MIALAPGIGPGLLYGLLAFLVGAVLGPLRELVLAPRIGGLAAALVEAAVMAPLLWLAARLASRGLPAGSAWTARAGMALAALGLVLLAEAALGAVLDASGLAAQRAPRSLPEQAVGWALIAWMLALPFLPRSPAGAAPPQQ